MSPIGLHIAAQTALRRVLFVVELCDCAIFPSTLTSRACIGDWQFDTPPRVVAQISLFFYMSKPGSFGIEGSWEGGGGSKIRHEAVLHFHCFWFPVHVNIMSYRVFHYAVCFAGKCCAHFLHTEE